MSDRYDIIPFIRDRKNVDPVSLSLKGILAINNMEQYLALCSDRIAAAGLIDGEDVDIDYVNFPNLILTEKGIMICRKILIGYTGEDKLFDLWDFVIDENAIRRSMNDQILCCRTLKSRHLRRFLRNPKKFLPDIDQRDKSIAEKLKLQFREELKSRSLINRARILAKKCIREIYFRIKYGWIISLMKESMKEVCRESSEK